MARMTTPRHARCASLSLLCGALVLLVAGSHAATARPETEPSGMEDMLDAIVSDARMTASYTGRATISKAVLDAMGRVQRDAFVPDGARAYAYENRPLAIGHGQTISQPFIVALMTDLLEPEPTDRVLEIGTGSGYQAAILAELVDAVYTVEIIAELAETAAARLAAQGHDNVQVKTGDGWYGWPEQGPFDGIMVTAVDETVPPQLVDQLAVGGRLVLPLGPRLGGQMLTVLTRQEDGGLTREDVLPVQFVPLTGDH
jgi:protein-L-isoaspartate(D-aspartate) O-methyltransferase